MQIAVIVNSKKEMDRVIAKSEFNETSYVFPAIVTELNGEVIVLDMKRKEFLESIGYIFTKLA